MKNKNEIKIQYMFGEDDENKAGFSLSGLKNLIMDKSELREEKMTSKDINDIRDMKDCLYAFSTTNTGICNALIFLGEKNNINDEFDSYHFNPWKAEWIFTPEYKKKRKSMIHEIRSSMDYRGEISDDEDSIVKFDDKKDYVNEKIKQLNDLYLKKRESIHISRREENKEGDIPIINNTELTNVQVGDNGLRFSKNTNLTNSSPHKNSLSLSETNQKFSIKDVLEENDKINPKLSNNISATENKFLTETNLFQKESNLNLANNSPKN